MTEVLCPFCNKPLHTIANQMARGGWSLLAECECGRRYQIAIAHIPRVIE